MGSDRRLLPVLPIRAAVLFPGAAIPVAVGRPRTVRAVEAALETDDKAMFVIALRAQDEDDPGPSDLHRVGTEAVIKKVHRSPDGTFQLIVVGEQRARWDSIPRENPFMLADVRPIPMVESPGPLVEALQRTVLDLAQQAAALADPQLQGLDLCAMLGKNEEVARTIYSLATLFSFDTLSEQEILCAPTTLEALETLRRVLSHEIEVLEIRSRIADQARSELQREQREHILREQLRAIRSELGEDGSEDAVREELRIKAAHTELPDEVRAEVERELSRLASLPSAAAEYHVIIARVELILELPWRSPAPDRIDITRARSVLDRDHHGLEDVKNRILEHLGVLRMNPNAKSPILCFVGAPGVGKTSLGKSIARALNRSFERLSLGGMHDEAELRGHRRTYVGAIPGRILTGIKRAKSRDPVFMLDEVDKLGRDFRGDPASALLEVLDPEQNIAFYDNYLSLPFDLSKVFFITTANSIDGIPAPLLDRMEVILLSGYTHEEKRTIAENYLVPRQRAQAGLSEDQLAIEPASIAEMIAEYTREAGVRQLERTIAKVARKVSLRFAEGSREVVSVRPYDLIEMLGPPPIAKELWRSVTPPGVAAGLAWTESGGDVIYVEAAELPEGKGVILTGQLGDVMKESAQAAHSWLWSHSESLGIDRQRIAKAGVHVHVPAAAIPKDGPSAGITIATALASLFAGRPARTDTAMTGEMTLAGLVLPVGGVKEKVLAAHRAGFRRLILPRPNARDLTKLPDDVRREVKIVFVETVDEVLHAVLASASARPVRLSPDREPDVSYHGRKLASDKSRSA
jgi:ATP-dependent Lon protease